MSLALKLLQRVQDYPCEKLELFGEKIVYGFGCDDERIEIAKRFGWKTRIVRSLSDISWLDIVFRRITISRTPSKQHFAKTSVEKWKRRFLRHFCDSIDRAVNICWLHEALLLKHGDRTLFTVSTHVAQIYAAHLPGFKVLQVINEIAEDELREVCFRLTKIGEKYVDKDEGVTVFANITTPLFIRAYRMLHPNRKIILRFHDLIKTGEGMNQEEIVAFVDALKRDGVIDEVESYDLTGAKILGGKFRPNGIDPDFILGADVPYRERLYYFSGTTKQQKTNESSRLSSFFDVVEAVQTLYPNTNVWNVAKNHDSKEKWLPYVEFVKMSSRSEVYVDLYRIDPNEGFSFRIPEALWLNRKIISNRSCLQKERFYSPERIFLIGVDPIERLRSFLETDIEPLSTEILQFYDTRLWWTKDDPAKEVYE